MSSTEATNMIEALAQARIAVQKLTRFRDDFVEQRLGCSHLFSDQENTWSDAMALDALLLDVKALIEDKSVAMRETFDSTLHMLKQMEPLFATALVTEKAEFCYLNGKMLNAIHSDLVTDVEATELTNRASQWLARALKFDPQNIDAWCELGETSWRQGHPEEAINHFRHALKLDPSNVEAMCQLSMALRQIPPTPPSSGQDSDDTPTGRTRKSLLDESMTFAHEACRHDPSNGQAWSVLGNALLTLYFESYGASSPPPSNLRGTRRSEESTSPKAVGGDANESGRTSSQAVMARCVAAYTQAVKDRKTRLEPSFHFNRGIAWHYQEKFAHCLRSWLRASCLDPLWPAPRACALRLTNLLLEAKRQVDQAEANRVQETTASGDTPPVRVNGAVTKSHHHRRDLLGPLAPFLLLCTPTPLPTLFSGDVTVEESPAIDTEPKTPVKPSMTPNERAAVQRLLGPYYHHDLNGDSPAEKTESLAVALLGGSRSARRKKANKHQRQNAQPTCPFAQRSTPFRCVLFDTLKVGPNPDCLCVCRVTSLLTSDTEVALNLLVLDARGTPLVVRLCNIGKGLGPVRRDILTIPHPFIEDCQVDGSLLHAVLTVQAMFGDAADCDTKSQQQMPSGREGAMSKLLSDTRLNNADASARTDAAKPSVNTTTGSNQVSTPNVSLRILRVSLPDVLVVNGQAVGHSWTAAPFLQNIFFTAT